jgi:GH15 family glucan-1,4-alpha-glucosidase
MVDSLDSVGQTDRVLLSVQAVLRNQSPNGAIIASADFAQYRFCWLRDGSFSAYALDLAGEHEASMKYHLWVREAVDRIAPSMDRAIAAAAKARRLDPLTMPPARFALDGSMVVDDWPNFQIDGYGTWLWSLDQHLALRGTRELPLEYRQSVGRVARYLSAYSLSPCFDVWEENGDAVHTSTLASVYAGLVAASRLLGDSEYREQAIAVRSRILDDAQRHGSFIKSSKNFDVDASLLWLGRPFGVVAANDPLFAETIGLIEQRLELVGGIRRYPTDVYFGSGAWPVLTASLGLQYLAAGDHGGAERCRDWITDHFDAEGQLVEQLGGELRDPQNYDAWVDRWGLPAQNLTWSHAMYVVLSTQIDRASTSAQGVTSSTSSTDALTEGTP